MPVDESITMKAASKKVILRRGILCGLGGLLLAGGFVGLLLGRYGYFSVSPSTAAYAEVPVVFAELMVRQEQHMLETGSYLGSHQANAESDWWPVARSHESSGKRDLLPLPSKWKELNFPPRQERVHCSYVFVTGDGGDSTNIGPIAAKMFGYSAPKAHMTAPYTPFGAWRPPHSEDGVREWYYLLAHCDMDNDPSVDSYYFMSSSGWEFYSINPGR